MEYNSQSFKLGKFRQQNSLIPEILLYILKAPMCKLLFKVSRVSRIYLLSHYAILKKFEDSNTIMIAIKRDMVTVSNFVSNNPFTTKLYNDEVTYIKHVKTDKLSFIACGTIWSGLYIFCAQTGKLLSQFKSICKSRCCYYDRQWDTLYVQADNITQEVDDSLRHLDGPNIQCIRKGGFKLIPSIYAPTTLYLLQRDGLITELDLSTGKQEIQQIKMTDLTKVTDIYGGVVISCFYPECLALACDLGLVLWDPPQQRIIGMGKVHAVQRYKRDGSLLVYSSIQEQFQGIILQDLLQDTILQKINHQHCNPLELKLLGSYKNSLIVNDREGIHFFDLDRDHPKGILLWTAPIPSSFCKGLAIIKEFGDQKESSIRVIWPDQGGSNSIYSLIQLTIPS
ncbi:hypothetical protein FGO68_gene7722 [Halteria grandinella]|uniref:Uncharacterized protein n=1 Tax=Halteria grandinella TaxID=5974 RepID=A0A8J8NN40_HALGN|nr:hypothetical protein FGO68_gene7722 [Halteria grandinella]